MAMSMGKAWGNYRRSRREKDLEAKLAEREDRIDDLEKTLQVERNKNTVLEQHVNILSSTIEADQRLIDNLSARHGLDLGRNYER